MSADLSFELKMEVTGEEFAQALKVFNRYGIENAAEYKRSGKGVYLLNVKINGKKLDTDTFEDVSGEVTVEAFGPFGTNSFGTYYQLDDLTIFIELAKAIPNACFKGKIDGFVTGAEVSLEAEFEGGKLSLHSYHVADEYFPTLYEKKIEKLLPYDEFCKMFKLDKECFDEYCYSEFINDAIAYEEFPDIDYDTFMEYCDCSEIDEVEYESAAQKLRSVGLVDFRTFMGSVNFDDYMKHTVMEV